MLPQNKAAKQSRKTKKDRVSLVHEGGAEKQEGWATHLSDPTLSFLLEVYCDASDGINTYRSHRHGLHRPCPSRPSAFLRSAHRLLEEALRHLSRSAEQFV